MKYLGLKTSADSTSDFHHLISAKIVIVPSPSLLIILGLFPKLIPLNLLGMSYKPRHVHISHYHSISALCFHQILHSIQELSHLIPSVRNHMRRIPGELVKLNSILLDFHVTMP